MSHEIENTTSSSSKGFVTKIVIASFEVTIIKHEGDGESFVEWKYLVEVSVEGMEKDEHLTEICTTDPNVVAARNTEEHVLALLVNTIDRYIQSVITLCKIMKVLWDISKFIYGKSDNLIRI